MGSENGDLLYEIVDVVGIDVDRFRLAQGASSEKLFLTGIELGLAAASYLAWRWIRGFERGFWASMKSAGLDPDQLGEQAGKRVGAELARRIGQLSGRSEHLLEATPDEVRELAPATSAEIGEILHDLGELEASVTAEVGMAARREARGDVAGALTENGFASERAAELAERIAGTLLNALEVDADSGD